MRLHPSRRTFYGSIPIECRIKWSLSFLRMGVGGGGSVVFFFFVCVIVNFEFEYAVYFTCIGLCLFVCLQIRSAAPSACNAFAVGAIPHRLAQSKGVFFVAPQRHV